MEKRPTTPVASISDTSATAEKVLFDAYRRMSASEKLARVDQLVQLADKLALAGIVRQYPSASPQECRLRLASRKYKRELMVAAFSWDPAIHGY